MAKQITWKRYAPKEVNGNSACIGAAQIGVSGEQKEVGIFLCK